MLYSSNTFKDFCQIIRIWVSKDELELVCFFITLTPTIAMLTLFYPTALKGCLGIVFTHGVQMAGAGGRKKFVRIVSQKP